MIYIPTGERERDMEREESDDETIRGRGVTAN